MVNGKANSLLRNVVASVRDGLGVGSAGCGAAVGRDESDGRYRSSGGHDADDHLPAPAAAVDLVEAALEDLAAVVEVGAHGDLLGFIAQRGEEVGLERVHAHASIRFCRAAVAR
jgi:hypothetical protein